MQPEQARSMLLVAHVLYFLILKCLEHCLECLEFKGQIHLQIQQIRRHADLVHKLFKPRLTLRPATAAGPIGSTA
jgi:hypothetical protein